MSLARFMGVLTAGTVATAVVLIPTAPAQAANIDFWNVDHISEYNCGRGASSGYVEWYNRTALVDGEVRDRTVNGCSTTVVFEAFAGSVKVQSVTRTANNDATSSYDPEESFSFTIGDPNRVGGINRIKINTCVNHNTPTQSCTQVTAHRDS